VQAEDAPHEALRAAVLLHQPAAGAGAVLVNRTAFRIKSRLYGVTLNPRYISTFLFLFVRVTRWPGVPPAVHERNHAVRLAAPIFAAAFPYSVSLLYQICVCAAHHGHDLSSGICHSTARVRSPPFSQ
jgi:hypothetical protein